MRTIHPALITGIAVAFMFVLFLALFQGKRLR